MRRVWISWALLASAAAGWCVPIVRRMIHDGDYRWHLGATADLMGGILRLPHLLFHLNVAAVVALGMSVETAAITTTVAFQVTAAFTVAWSIRWAAPDTTPPVAALLALAVIVAGPILPPAAERELYMIGYFLPNAIHNPTVIAAKPFVPLLISIAAVSSGLANRPAWNIRAAAVVTVLAALAKPHYVGCIVPAAAAVTAVRWTRRKFVRVPLAVLGLATPALVALAVTYVMVRRMPGDAEVIFAPLEVLGLHVPVDATSILQRSLSALAFPVVAILCWPSVLRHAPWLLLAWMAYAIALVQAYVLAESGPRLTHGNFLWSPQLATFGLFAAHAAALPLIARAGVPAARWRILIAASVLAAHAAYGAWWVMDRVAPSGWWWTLAAPPVVAAAEALYRRRPLLERQAPS